MSTIADLIIKLGVDAGGVEKGFKSASASIASASRSALIPATAALGAMGVVGKAAFDNLQDGARNAKQTEAVIASTGDASNVTAKHVDSLAMSLRQKAGVDDDVVHAGENMLLTFTNIRNEAGKGNDIFDQSTKIMLDMSHALGTSTTDSALQLGKALHDPIRGMTALQRVGVTFTDAQKQQVKAMVDSGHAMDAQKLILHELNKEFGGSATNIDPTTRAIDNMKLDAVDLASSLLQSLMPALQTFVGILGKATGFLTDHERATKIVVGAVGALAVAVIATNVAMKVYQAGAVLVKVATAAWTAAQWLLNAALTANPVALVIIALVALGAALVVAYTKSETFRKIVNAAWEAVKTTALAVFNGIRDAVTATWNAVERATAAVVDFLKTHWKEAVIALALILVGPLGALVALIATHWSAIQTAASNAWGAVKAVVVGAVTDIKTVVSTVFNALASVVKTAAGLVAGAASAVAGAFSPITTVLGDIVSGAEAAAAAIDKVVGVASKIGGVGGKVLHALHVPGFASGVRNYAGGLAVVGENGPELVSLPGGSSVYTNAESRGMVGGGAPLGGDGDVVLQVDGREFIRFARRELDRIGVRNARPAIS